MVRQVTAILDYQIDVAMQCPQHVSDAIAITLIGANVTDPRSDRPFSLRRQDVHTDDVRRRKQASQPTDRVTLEHAIFQDQRNGPERFEVALIEPTVAMPIVLV
jgi:hypothetical protein